MNVASGVADLVTLYGRSVARVRRTAIRMNMYVQNVAWVSDVKEQAGWFA